MRVSYGQRLSWCYEGQKVIAPVLWHGKPHGLVGTVTKACGTSAYVENARYGLHRWFDTSDLHQAIFTPDPSPGPGEPLPFAA